MIKWVRLTFSYLQVEKDLENSPTGWFAGGPEPTSADFMMLLAMEGMPRVLGDSVPQHMIKWVDTVHARPAYKRVSEGS
jgi:glutathione S-transferase